MYAVSRAAGMGYTVDTTMNTALYGPNTTPNAILEGGVEPPPAMKELYDVLDRVSLPLSLLAS